MDKQKVFLAKARDVHGGRYDYSKAVFSTSHGKVEVICPLDGHGSFWPTAKAHVGTRKSGCPACSGKRPLTQDEFVARSSAAYGVVYDYSQCVFTKSADRVTVICPEHGPWEPVANNHIRGNAGCPVCAGNQPMTTETFIAKSRAAHGGMYDYSLVAYSRSKSLVTIICAEHGAFDQIPNSHLSGQGCPKCAGKGVLTLEGVVALSREIHGDKFDYSLTTFRTTQEKLTLICKSCSTVFEQEYSAHIYQKSGCAVCAGNALKDTETFKREAREVHADIYDYSLVAYTGKAKKVRIICPKHGEFSQTPNAHLMGRGCPACAYENKFVSTAEYIAAARAVHGDKYDYSKTEYTGSTERVVVTCPEHGDWRVFSASHLYRGTGCPACAGTRLLTTDEFIAKARGIHGDRYDYSKVDYVNYNTKVAVGCAKHGEWMATPDSILQGHGCSRCANVGPTKPQLEIQDFLAGHTLVIPEHRFPGSMKRFDIFLPEKNLAVEYNGLYWHSSRTQNGDETERSKYDLAMSHGVRTIFIYEDEWEYHPNSVKNVLLSAIGGLPRLYARKCQLVTLSRLEAGNFYYENHMQLSPNSPVNIGLKFDGQLVACMSFGMLRSSRRNTDRRHWELTRYSATHTVVGGASRLLASFRKLGIADRLTSYSDVRMFSGNMYKQLGFTLTHQTRPDYSYVNTRVHNSRAHKAHFQKKHLVKLFPGCDIVNKTEKQICAENGYHQVYDCGKVRWDLDLTHNS